MDRARHPTRHNPHLVSMTATLAPAARPAHTSNRGRYDHNVKPVKPVKPVRRVVTAEDLKRTFADPRPSTPDDVCITRDGRRLDTREKLLAFLVEIDAIPAPEPAVDDE